MSKITTYKRCPKCKEDSLHDIWRPKRKLRQECVYCNWKGKDRVPEQKEIKIKKRVMVNRHGGFSFEVYDKYGYVRMYSRSYDTKEKVLEEIERELEIGKKAKYGGPYTAIMYPTYVEVEGEIFK